MGLGWYEGMISSGGVFNRVGKNGSGLPEGCHSCVVEENEGKGMKKILMWVLGASLFVYQSVPALELVRHGSLAMPDALRIAKVALRECHGKGYKVSVAVVDRGGNLQVLLRDEDAGPHTVDSSYRKAYTALSLDKPTRELADLVAKKRQLQGLGDMNESILILGGGLPVHIAGQLVGGVGVGGAPGAKLDEDCARKGIQSIGVRAD